MLLVERAGLPPISDLARPMWRLAGLRIDPDLLSSEGEGSKDDDRVAVQRMKLTRLHELPTPLA
ncbi:MAG: hypothetical protein IH926_04925 [Proteobacteria bacterium]|nr:hypothetical protein [Pseudomonadota bacterium]